MPPGSRYAPTAVSPADAMQPHCEQSGLPPNWQGVMRCSKSAEMQLVVCAKMHRSVATVSMSGTLRDKLEAIAAARFDGYELFENDLLYYNGTPAEVGRLATHSRVHLGLART